MSGWEDPLKEEIPPVVLPRQLHGQGSLMWLQSMGWKRAGHDWGTEHKVYTIIYMYVCWGLIALKRVHAGCQPQGRLGCPLWHGATTLLWGREHISQDLLPGEFIREAAKEKHAPSSAVSASFLHWRSEVPATCCHVSLVSGLLPTSHCRRGFHVHLWDATACQTGWKY